MAGGLGVATNRRRTGVGPAAAGWYAAGGDTDGLGNRLGLGRAVG